MIWANGFQRAMFTGGASRLALFKASGNLDGTWYEFFRLMEEIAPKCIVGSQSVYWSLSFSNNKVSRFFAATRSYGDALQCYMNQRHSASHPYPDTFEIISPNKHVSWWAYYLINIIIGLQNVDIMPPSVSVDYQFRKYEAVKKPQCIFSSFSASNIISPLNWKKGERSISEEEVVCSARCFISFS